MEIRKIIENKLLKSIMNDLILNEINFLHKLDKQIRGYHCGHHKRLLDIVSDRKKRLIVFLETQIDNK